TNVAETSLTVPGIRFVIDSGLARVSRYATHSKVLRLPVEPVSQAACNQRAGRCGRVGPGTCIRLFDQDDFERRPEFTEPEIQRTSLVGVVLEMLSLKLGDPERFPFLDQPPSKLINEAWTTLVELQAIDGDRRLTPIGRQMARMPVDPRQARILIEAHARGALADALVLVAAVSVADPRERPLDQQQAADQAHAAFQVPGSDFMGLLKLWHWWQQLRADHSRNQANKHARTHFLSANRLHEWGQLQGQLRQLARENGWSITASPAWDERANGRDERAQAIHRALLAGLLSQVGQHDTDDGANGPARGHYRGARGHQFRIFPGSSLAKSSPGWIMAAELVETSRPYARMVATIEPEWLEQQAAHLTRSRVYDPHWDRRSGRVMGFQQVSLFGLILVEKRKIHFGPHAPEEARALFIRHALVRGEMNHRAHFLKRNRQLQQELAQHEHKRRQRDVLADEGQLLAFFNERLPSDIYTVKAFARWYEGLAPKAQQQLLYDRATLLRENAPTSGTEFPDRLAVDGEHYTLRYRFEPGHVADGLTLICPLHQLNRLDVETLEWLVPGLLNDKIRALLSTLPKSKRRAFVPAAEYAQAALEALGQPDGSLRARLARQLSRIGGLVIEPDDFQTERLPEHLIMNVRVLGEGGKVLTESRDLTQLQSTLGQQARKEFMQRQADEWLQDGLKTLDQQLPNRIKTRTGHSAWPALVDQEQAVGLRLFDDEEEAHLSHQYGVHRLALISLADKLRYVAKQHRLSSAAALAWTRIGDVQALERRLHERVVFDAIEDPWTVRSPEALSELEQQLRPRLVHDGQRAIEQLDHTVLRWHDVRSQLNAIGPAQPSAQADIESQLDDLLYPEFTADVSIRRLTEYPRYLEGIEQRLHALEIDPRRDVQRQAEIEPWWQRYLKHIHSGLPYSPELNQYRWLIEEYRIQVFAQQLGTREKVSAKRLEYAWQAVSA
ncbi:MAG: ATP-dependent RNA helicase HrpA, partial [Pseudomonadota bacterium]